MKQPYFWGIRHLSPAGAYHLRKFLDEVKPQLVLVEGPGDFNDMIPGFALPETVPPIAVLAYTREAPVRTILYPFAVYSPEYQACLWCLERGVECRFMDLPSEVFLGLGREQEKRLERAARFPEGDGEAVRREDDGGAAQRMGEEAVYAGLEKKAGAGGQETFWERTLEQALDAQGYRRGTELFGASLRELTLMRETDREETLLREACMRRRIREAVEGGISPDRILVVTGAYHVEGLRTWEQETKGKEADWQKYALPASHTLMPYSYYRLSARSGYGAGNKAPAYYELLWEAQNRGEPMYAAYSYLSRIAAYQRANGTSVSSAEVIEAVRLSASLAALRGGRIPALIDLRDAAVTCLGGGSFSRISLAAADTEIGTKIGSLPEGVSRTSLQEDFYRQLEECRLEKYRDLAAQDLKLDLRENRSVKSEKSAFLDLHRSFFLHQLRILGVSFAAWQRIFQENATWSEHWVLRWTPEAEIELVEAAMKGDTIAQAASFALKERVENAPDMGAIAQAVEDAFGCGMGEAARYATDALQAMAVDAASVEELAETLSHLSAAVQYGSIRRVDPAPLIPVMQQLFLRACLILPGACVCDDAAAGRIAEAMERLNGAALAHEFLQGEEWTDALGRVAYRDDLNTVLSGFGAAILLERGRMDNTELKTEVSRRLSRGVPADLGAGWFEGLARKNHYALIARLSLWESLDAYLDTLDDEEFKRALVFLRRAFADFSSREKDEIAENLGEIWGLNGSWVSETVNAALNEQETGLVESLDDFDFE